MAVSTPQSPVLTDRDGYRYQQSSSAVPSPQVDHYSSSPSKPGRELKPIGIHNESNTCFINSTFQALSATPSLATLLSNSPQSPLYVNPHSSLPSPTVSTKLIPSLQPEILEPPLYDLVPVTRAFTNSLHRAWRMKEAGGGTYGSGETSSTKSMSLNSLLREIARKYDQYDDYSQQDAHELLRHLLDSMEMEEKDVIKKLQPHLPNLSNEQQRRKSRRSSLSHSQSQPQSQSQSRKNSTRSGTVTPGLGISSISSNSNNNNNVNNNNFHNGLMDLKHISPLPSPLPSPAHTRPSSPHQRDVDPMATAIPFNANGEVTGHVITEEPIFSPSDTPFENGMEIVQNMSNEERLIPFVDVLFGGSLASVVVCEKCKAVSHTYEGFLDISLSLKGDDPKPRKRDRLKAMARVFRPRKSSTPQTANSSDTHHSHSVVSESELSENEGPKEGNRRKSMESEDRSIAIEPSTGSTGGLSRSGSINKGFAGIAKKSSFSFGRKKAKPPPASASPVTITSPSLPSSIDGERTPPTSTPGSPSLHGQGHVSSDKRHGQGHHSHHRHHRQHGPGPTPAQAAYISRILAPPPGTLDVDDPLARLRAANSGQNVESSTSTSSSNTQDYGLIEALRAFTSVEVLEGENAFACKKCWKIKHGRYAKHEATVREEDEDQIENLDNNDLFHASTRQSVSSTSTMTSTTSRGTSPLLIASPRVQQGPQISILGSPSSEKSILPSNNDATTDGRLGRSSNISTSAKSPMIRAPSPLRMQLEQQEQNKLVQDMSSTTLSSTYGSDSALTLDSSSTSLDEFSSSQKQINYNENGDDHDDDGSDGLSDSETSTTEGEDSNKNVNKPKIKRKKSNHAHVVMGRAFKRYLIAKKPEVMVFHFKRFKQTQKSNYGFSSFYDLKKIDDFVSFPENLDLAPFLAPNRQDYKVHQTTNGPKATYMDWPNPEQGPELEPVMYRLYAVVVHLGTMIGGHYIAYCLVDPERMFGDNPNPNSTTDEDQVNEAESKTPTVEPHDQDHQNSRIRASNSSVKSSQSGLSGMSGLDNNNSNKHQKDRRVWCFCSDTSIRLASIEEVLSQKAYLCFYEKVTQ
ncbi:uncharacterized protein IL334_004180 [Kwoniella shivajii]|uniref:USP domain-containing protein n=1 Tax=Kwoniella shivajii TaxID=564305 RepID=A0ABZ1D0Z4_9TREE|nr:hypothetical protein IL334_004180 [Kwoniella shivajii]